MALKDRNRNPPGNWFYEQKDADGNLMRVFRSDGTFLVFCKEILAYRKGNKLSGATLDQVMSDVDDATCLRLGNDPLWVYNGVGGSYAPGRTVRGAPCCGG